MNPNFGAVDNFEGGDETLGEERVSAEEEVSGVSDGNEGRTYNSCQVISRDETPPLGDESV
jgi:hypothetical protein